jgi:hypothetical protein
MKKILLTCLTITIATIAFSQHLLTKTLQIKDSAWINGQWVKKVTTDTAAIPSAGNNEVPSTRAMYDFVQHKAIAGGATDTTPLHNQIAELQSRSVNPPLLYNVITGKYDLDTSSRTGATSRYRFYFGLDSAFSNTPFSLLGDVVATGSSRGASNTIVRGIFGKWMTAGNPGWQGGFLKYVDATPGDGVDNGGWVFDSTLYASLSYVNGNFAAFLQKTNNLSDLLNVATARTNLGATTVGSNLFTATNPSAVRWIRVNADNTISFRTAAETLSDIGGGATPSLTQYYVAVGDASNQLSGTNDFLFQGGELRIGYPSTDNGGYKLQVNGDAYYSGSVYNNGTYVNGTASVNGLFLQNPMAPTQITADQNNYSPTGIGSKSSLKISSDAARNITGILGQSEGQTLWIQNVGAFDITLKNQSASSTASNRFALNGDYVIKPNETATLIYDYTGSQRWRAIGKQGAATSAADSSTLYAQWPLKKLNDSTIKIDQADATHDGFLDSADWAGFDSVHTAYINGTIVKTTATQTLTNKRITVRVGTTASSATITPDADANDVYTVTALAANATIAAPSGTPTGAQQLLIRIKDDGTARTLTWNAIYRASTDFALPTTTTAGKTMYVQFIYNATDSKYDAIGLTQGF